MPDIVPVEGKPGVLLDTRSGKLVIQTEVREDDFYDSTLWQSGSISAGTSKVLFRDLTDKNTQHMNIDTSRRIPAANKMNLQRVGLMVRPAVGNLITSFGDNCKLYDAVTVTFKLNTRVIVQGVALKYSSGYGLTGVTTANNVSAVSLGVPSTAAAAVLERTQPIGDQDSLNGELRVDDAAWVNSYAAPVLDQRCVTTIFLHGVIEKPQGT